MSRTLRALRSRIIRLAAAHLVALGIGATALADHQCGHVSTVACSATVSGALSSSDCRAPDLSFYDLWEFSGTTGQVVTIDLTSNAFDTYLILVDPSQNGVAENDDAGATTNSRIVFTLTASGTWTIVANSFDSNEFGNYNLSLGCSASTTDTVSYLPIAGHQPGRNNTMFISDVRIVNRSGTADTVRLDFYPLNPAGVAGPGATSTLTIASGEQAVLNDVVLTRFNTTGLGAIRVTSTQPLEVISRIINDQRPIGEGTAGFAFRARTLSQAKADGTLPFLSNASPLDQDAGLGFRTNLGYFNPTSSAVTVTFTARRTMDGVTFGSDTVTIPALASRLSPIFDVITSVTEADRVQTDYYITYQASAPIFIYASITDNKTGDGILVD
jgi:hypothetical protein